MARRNLRVPLHLTGLFPQRQTDHPGNHHKSTSSVSLFIRCIQQGVRVNSQILALKTNRKQANKPFRLSCKLLSSLPLLPLLTLLITLKGSEVKILLIIRVDLCVFHFLSTTRNTELDPDQVSNSIGPSCGSPSLARKL